MEGLEILFGTLGEIAELEPLETSNLVEESAEIHALCRIVLDTEAEEYEFFARS